MKNFFVLVVFKLILLLSACFAYIPLYQVANQDLLKGILLGALLAGQKHPHHYMPMPYYNGYMSPQSPYVYPNPNNQNNENQESQDTEYSEPTEPTESNSEETTKENQNQVIESRQQKGYKYQQKYGSEPQSQAQTQQLSESLTDSVITESPSVLTPTNSVTTPTEPVIPSIESLQRNLGLSSHSVILMILPTSEEIHRHNNQDQIIDKTNATEALEPNHQLVSSDESFKTNAIKVGTKELNPKGWKPVPKTTTQMTPTVPEIRKYENYNKYNSNRYIVGSQFGLRNRFGFEYE